MSSHERSSSNAGRGTLTEAEFDDALAVVLAHVDLHGSVSNSDVRAIAGLTYDQAIRFFGIATAHGHLLRLGRGAGTRYRRHPNRSG